MTASTPAMASQAVTSFSPLRIRSADTPPQLEKVITPGREPTREERKLARRRNGPMDALPHYVGKRLKFTLPSALDSELATQSHHSTLIAPSPGTPALPKGPETPCAVSAPAKQSARPGQSTPTSISSSKSRASLTDQVLTKVRRVSERHQMTNGARSRKPSGSRGHQISSSDFPAKPKGLRESVKGKEKASSVTEGRTILQKVKKFWSSDADHAGGPLEFASPSKLMISAKPATSLTGKPVSIRGPEHSRTDNHSDSEYAAHHARPANHGAKQQTGSASEDSTSSKPPTYPVAKKRKVCSADESHNSTSSAAVLTTSNTKHLASASAPPSETPNGQLARDAARAPGLVQVPSINALPKKICRPRNDSASSVAAVSAKEDQIKNSRCPPAQPNLCQLPDTSTETSKNLTSQPTRPKTAMAPAHKLSKNASGKLQPKTNSFGAAPESQPNPDYALSLPKTKKANQSNRSRKKADVDQSKENLDPGSFNSISKRLAFAPLNKDQPRSCLPMRESDKLFSRMTNINDGMNQLGDCSSQGSSTPSGSRRRKQYQKGSVSELRAEGASKVPENVPTVINTSHLGSVSDGCATVPSTPQRARSASSDEAEMKRLAARVFTPAAARLQLPEVPKKVAGPPHQAANQQRTDAQPAGGEEQLYIVADRYACESESEDEEQTPEMAKLAVKIKSQLNPPDIIWISIRKLIRDELARLDGSDSQDGEEREVLEGVYGRFKTHMLEYAHELVKHGLMKLRLHKLAAEEKAICEREGGAAGSSVADSMSCGSLDQPSKRTGESTQLAGGRKRAQKAAPTGDGTSKSGAPKKTGRPVGLAHSKGILGNSKGKRAKKAK